MSCNKRTNSHDRFLAQQEHRQINRLWKKAIEKLSSTEEDLENEFGGFGGASDKRRFDQSGLQFECKNICSPEEGKNQFPSESIQRKLMKGRSVPKIKSPLQKFDEIVSREFASRRTAEGAGGMSSFDSSKLKNLQFTGALDFGWSKLSPENKVSRGALQGVEKEVREFDPSNAEHAALMDAIEKLAQAQAFCRFDAAVKAAEAATASVPPEMAEEVAVACAKDYQSDIIDVINEKISLSEERKPIEVIGYIGVTKLKDNL